MVSKPDDDEKEEPDDEEELVDIASMLPLEGDKKEVQDEKGLKILTANKPLTRLPIALAQITVGNNS